MRTSSRRATVVSAVLFLLCTASYVQAQTALDVAPPLVGGVSAQTAPVITESVAVSGSVSGASCGIRCGDRVQVINVPNVPGSRLHVRTELCDDTSNGACGAICCDTICGRVWNGATGRVILPPIVTTSNGFAWSLVQWDEGWPFDSTCGAGRTGLSAEGTADGSQCWLTPVERGCCLDADCDDGIPCTTDTCTGYPTFTCQYSGACPGACCFANGGCSSLTATNCATQGGTYHGDNTSCGSVNCGGPPPTGACCISNTCYTGYTLSSCQNQGGAWQGPGTGTCTNCEPQPVRYTLTLQSNPSNGGTISASPERDPDDRYPPGTQVQLTAYPNTNYTFLSWSGDASGSSHTTTVTMNADRSVTANFPDARAGILRVEPGTDFRSSAPTAIGPFNPSSLTYYLKNIGGQPISWALSGGLSPWLNVSQRNGTLQSGQQTSVMVSVSPAGLNILQSLCNHEDHIEFLNTTNGSGNVTRDIQVTTGPCQVSDSTDQDSGVTGLPPDITFITAPHNGLRRWNGTSFIAYLDLVPIDPTKPTFIFAHGWEGDPSVWDDTAEALAASPPYDTANILAWDWWVDANPNGDPDVDEFFARIADADRERGLIGAYFYASSVYQDAKRSGENAEQAGGVLAQVILNSYPTLRTQLHLIGKSHGGGLLAVTASKLPYGHARAESLTMLDTPNRWGVDSMHYLTDNPQSASQVIVMYYSSLGGVGAPAPSPAINMSLNPEYVDFPEHSHVTDSWFPGLFVNGNGLSIGDAPIDFPHDISTLEPNKWWGETGRYNFQPMGACCTYSLFGYEGCDERLERDCGSSPAAPRVWAGPQTRCSIYVGCPITVTGSTLEGTGEVAPVPESVHNPFPGMVPILTLPLDSAAEWQGDGAVVATALDPNGPANSVVFLQEDGDATIYRTFQWPANVFELSFDYMFRDPRGDENLTVYLDDRIVFYDHAATSLATTGLTRSSGRLVADLAGNSGRLAFVLRTDGTPGGGVLLDNVTLWGFLPGDMDADGHIDLADYAVFQRCFGSNPPEFECVLVDFDKDGSVTLNDFTALQQCLEGASVLGDPRCNAPPVCGNGIVEAGEECDPPNGRTCDAVCTGLVLEPDGTIVGWGWNESGQTNPPPGGSNSAFVAVAGGAGHNLGLKADGSIVAWGCGLDFDYGQCDVPAPNTRFVGIAAGSGHSLGLEGDGFIVAWGANDDGQTNVPSPNTGFIAVAAGGAHGLGLKADGSIVAWGHNYLGQANVPAPNTGFVAVAARFFHSLGLKTDGSIVAWGRDFEGQTNVPAPNTGFVRVAAGWWHSLGLKADGSIVAWGCGPDRDYGQCDVPAPNTGFVAVAAGGYHSLGLKADGSIVAWGCGSPDYDFGECNVPIPNTRFVAVAAGISHSLAIRGNR